VDVELSFQQLFEAMPCYLTVQDRELKILNANDRFRKRFGEYEGHHCHQLYKHRGEPCERCPVVLAFNDGESHHSEQQLTCRNGTPIPAIAYASPVRNERGEIVAVMEICADISEAKLLETQLRESQERYRLMFEEVPCCISIQDPDLRIIEANRSFREDFGDYLGSKCYEIYKRRDKACVPCSVQEAFRDGQIHQTEEAVKSRHGKSMDMLVSAAPIRNSRGEIHSVMEMSANITQVRELQSQLASVGLLISTISHGIKGLLTGLDGGIYLVNTGLKKDDQARVQKGWDMVLRNVDKIKSMVMDMLYYARDREPRWTAVDAVEAAGEVLAIATPKAERRGIELRKDFDSNAGEFQADPQALRSMLINLVDNALDACCSERKRPDHWVRLKLTGRPGHVEFVVDDNGVGMDQEALDKAFSLFFSSKGAEGTGLGLFIANKIAQAHGGAIELSSELDRGTRIVATMPRERVELGDGDQKRDQS
jgi:PAS domain S-box-containing protein